LAGIDRPTTLPGNRPGGGNRPSIGGNRPGAGGAGERFPGIDRPGTRPGDRPVIGGGGNRPGRPGINNGNINIGNNVNIGGGNVIGNRPGWDHGNWNNPGWGWGGGGWAGNWHDHCINPHYGWYNGCWGGYWGSNWYAPLAWGAVGWGLGALTSGWGYGTDYYNPYYTESAVSVPYDYSQPVAVNYVDADAAAAAPADTPAPTPEAEQATQLFDAGLALFKSGDYRGALSKFDAALAKLPGDPVVHEVRAVTLFALGEYQQAAVALNSFLSSAPGMDWTTMSSLYGNVDDYQAQLRKLEQFCTAHPNDASAYFVLAYQYLVIGSKDPAIDALKVVVKNQPKDATAKRMLDALAPAPQTAAPAAAPAPAASDAPQTDLVGAWRAKAGDTTIDLAITEGSQFTWKAVQPGKPAVELKGDLTSTSDELVLESKDQGAMSGSVKSLGPDKWQFALAGAPPSDPGLSFVRVN
jgi:polyisoprenoid-binding protein YceI